MNQNSKNIENQAIDNHRYTQIFQLWPAIDIINGQPVRLLKGDYAQQTTYDTPLSELVATFNTFSQGIHVVDLDGAKQGKVINKKAIADIIKHAQVPVEVGGGIRSLKMANDLFELGVSRVIIGTRATQDIDFVNDLLVRFGAERVVIGVDVKDGYVATHGWENASQLRANDFIETLQKIGIQTIIYTDISTDGTLAGPPLETFTQLCKAFPELHFIASGGVGQMSDIQKLVPTGVQGVIFGKAFYEKKLPLAELQKFFLTQRAQ